MTLKKKLKPPYIEQNVRIGSGSIIFPGVRIGENTLIGAGTLVTKDIPSNCIAYGNPLVIKNGK